MFQYTPRHYRPLFHRLAGGFARLELRFVAMIRRRVVLFRLQDKREDEETSGERRDDEGHTG